MVDSDQEKLGRGWWSTGGGAEGVVQVRVGGIKEWRLELPRAPAAMLLLGPSRAGRFASG